MLFWGEPAEIASLASVPGNDHDRLIAGRITLSVCYLTMVAKVEIHKECNHTYYDARSTQHPALLLLLL